MAEQDITIVKNAETPFGAVKAVLQKGTAVKRIRKNAEPSARSGRAGQNF